MEYRTPYLDHWMFVIKLGRWMRTQTNGTKEQMDETPTSINETFIHDIICLVVYFQYLSKK